jgi:hypothetical protein
VALKKPSWRSSPGLVMVAPAVFAAGSFPL